MLVPDVRRRFSRRATDRSGDDQGRLSDEIEEGGFR
jgi:hypothetical protein